MYIVLWGACVWFYFDNDNDGWWARDATVIHHRGVDGGKVGAAVVVLYVARFVGCAASRPSASTWQALRSTYFAVVTLTTVGYGDIIPMRQGETAVAIVLVMLGARTAL